MSRENRVVETGGGRWRAAEAWRGRGGVGLLYFVALADGEPTGDREGDRRASLEPDEQLGDLSKDALLERLEAGTPLTDTERRFRAPDGDLWLAQSVGPVWAEDDVAEGLTGIVFTALEGETRRATGAGGHVGEAGEAELVARWRSAVDDDRAPERPESPS